MRTSEDLSVDIGFVVEEYHRSLDVFSGGDSKPVKNLFSHLDDVLLVNPFGHTVLGWKKVSEALDFASSSFSEGEVKDFEEIAKYESPELVVIFEIEKWKAKVSGRKEISSFDLRVTSIFRLEENKWKLIHRHADPISSFNSEGPLRKDF